MSEPTAPSLPAPPPPPPTPGRSLRLEVIAVSLVLLTAAGISVVAFLSGSSNGTPAADTGPAVGGATGSPTPSPSDELASPSTATPEPEPVAELVSFRRVDANLAPVGCEGDLTFAWFPDREAEPLVGQEAVIRVTGPQVAGTYRETFTLDGFSLEFQVALGQASRWTAVARSVGGRRADPSFVVEASIDSLPFC